MFLLTLAAMTGDDGGKMAESTYTQ